MMLLAMYNLVVVHAWKLRLVAVRLSGCFEPYRVRLAALHEVCVQDHFASNLLSQRLSAVVFCGERLIFQTG